MELRLVGHFFVLEIIIIKKIFVYTLLSFERVDSPKCFNANADLPKIVVVRFRYVLWPISVHFHYV